MAKITLLFLTVVLIYFILTLLSTESAPEDALVSQIPGFTDNFPSKHFSGWGNPTKDPVVLWLNGGPGCSSFDGFVYEHGPFNFEMGETKGSLPKLHLNPYSWSKVSNIIYLDSPAGVGFSYSGNKSDYITGDLKTASDSHTFLLKWFELYPEFLSNPFFICGESYAGVYVPTLAYEVMKGIDAGEKPVLNFKGYIVGNGVTDEEFDGNALVPFAYGMGLISQDLFEEVTSECQGNYYNPATDNCENKLAKVDKTVESLNIYNILEPCYHGTEILEMTTGNTKLPLSFRKLGETERPLPVRKRMFGRAWPLRAPVRDGIVPTWPQLLQSNNVPCTMLLAFCFMIIYFELARSYTKQAQFNSGSLDDEVATSWLNNEAVRKAIHAEQGSVAGSWELCTGRILFRHDAGSMIKYHKNLTSKGYRALIFSGDHDMCVPYTGSEAWTRSVGYKIVDEWRPWTSNGQVAGFLQEYENNLTFLTIKGSGHTVPEYKPREALDFYSRWLMGKTI
ncbi:unnamed protein product [Camellia sinensis]